MDYTTLVLESECIKLIPTVLEDTQNMFEEFTPEITKYMYPQPTGNIQDTIDFITNSWKKMQQGANFQFTIFDAKTAEFLGGGGLHRIDSNTPEFGIWIKKSAHGHGYGGEAMQIVKKWAEENLKYDYLLYPVAVANLPSRKIAEKLGGIIDHEYDEPNATGIMMHWVEYRVKQ